MKQIYFDNAATTKVDDKVVKVMLPYFTEKYGNASSSHLLGEEARRDLENARSVIAKYIGAKREEIIFTSSGTESNNFLLKGLFFSNYPEKNHIVTTGIEHDCILNACRWLETKGAEITYLKVDSNGFVDFDELKNSINEKTIVVSIIHGNNEIGTIQELKEIGRICKEKKVLFHTDACQSFTKVPINVTKMNLYFATINSHKIHGPKGVGALYIKEESQEKITPLLHGGNHEFDLRSATENIPGIAGFSQAVRISNSKDVRKMTELRDRLIEKLLEIPETELNGITGEKRLCNNVNISFKNVDSEILGDYLNAAGIFVSTGSACSSRKIEASHVLKAIGKKDEQAKSSIRLSLSKFNTEDEVDFVSEKIKNVVEKLRKQNKILKYN